MHRVTISPALNVSFVGYLIFFVDHRSISSTIAGSDVSSLVGDDERQAPRLIVTVTQQNDRATLNNAGHALEGRRW